MLDINPRSVDKHLEQIFEKLGVENRASAAAVTIAELTASGPSDWACVIRATCTQIGERNSAC